jgi:hypothetical protein
VKVFLNVSNSFAMAGPYLKIKSNVSCMPGVVVVGLVAAGVVDEGVVAAAVVGSGLVVAQVVGATDVVMGGVAAAGAEVVGPLEQLEKMKELISSTANGISSFFIDLSPYIFLLSQG